MLRSLFTLRGCRPRLILRDDMARVQVPTLVAWGDGDSFVPESRGRELAANMPDARFEIVRDAGHVLQLDQPAAIASTVAGFLAAGVSSSPAPRAS